MYARRSFAFAIIGLALLASVVYYLAPRLGPPTNGSAYGEKSAAAQTMLAAERAVLESRLEQAQDSQLVDDPTIAAMLGLPTSPITTDSGSLRAKITSTNPNFAALVVEFLGDAGVKSGDAVAVAYTGSFPALNIAAIAAIEALGAEPIIVSSVGASTWGANDPEFTFLDIESLLREQGIIHHTSIAASVGGDFRVHPLTPEARELTQLAMERNDVSFLNASKLQESIQQRLQIYEQRAESRPVKAFVNVGGGLSSVGKGENQPLFNPGLTIGPETGDIEAEGLLFYMRGRGVPVINLIDILSLARKYRFSLDPSTLPDVGEGTVWRDWPTLRIRAGVAAAVILLAVIAVRLLLLSPAGQREFDAYFGLLPARLKRRFGLKPQQDAGVPPSPVEPTGFSDESSTPRAD